MSKQLKLHPVREPWKKIPQRLWRKLNQGLWDTISSYLPREPAPDAANYAATWISNESEAHTKVWGAIFKNDKWLKKAIELHGHPVLIGADLDILSGAKKSSRRPKLVLAVLSSYSDCVSTLRVQPGWVPPGGGYKEIQLEKATLTVNDFSILSTFNSKDFRYLFSQNKQGKIETKYCYYDDPKKKIQILQPENIRGIGGQITEAQDLSPIFILRFKRNETWEDDEEYIFSNLGGWDNIIEYIFDEEGFTQSIRFSNSKFEELRHRDTDWVKVAEEEAL
jgi:hypothetical protein